jgi:hypothetical protein
MLDIQKVPGFAVYAIVLPLLLGLVFTSSSRRVWTALGVLWWWW